jgi:hypothetical protein
MDSPYAKEDLTDVGGSAQRPAGMVPIRPPLIQPADALRFSFSGCSLPAASLFSSPHKVDPMGNFRG